MGGGDAEPLEAGQHTGFVIQNKVRMVTMTKQKKWLLIGLVILLAIVVVLLLGLGHLHKQLEEEEEERAWEPGERPAYVLQTMYPTDIIWFGTSYPVEYEVSVRYEQELTEETLKIKDGFEHAYIVLSDRNGTLDISEEQIRMIKELVVRDGRYSFVYFGTDLMPIFEKLGFRGKELDLSEYISYSEINSETGLRVILNGVPDDIDAQNVSTYVFYNLADEWTD